MDDLKKRSHCGGGGRVGGALLVLVGSGIDDLKKRSHLEWWGLSALVHQYHSGWARIMKVVTETTICFTLQERQVVTL